MLDGEEIPHQTFLFNYAEEMQNIDL